MMRCLNPHLSKLMFIAVLFLHVNFSYAGDRDDLYKKGNDAYERKDYVTSLKNLYAYYVLNEVEINKHQVFKKKIYDRIATFEAKLKSSFASNLSIEKGDKTIHIIKKERGGLFGGKGKEVGDSLEINKINLDAIQNFNNKAVTTPSRER